MKAIFLNFDGVLNKLDGSAPPTGLHLEPANVAHLNQIAARCRAAVVLTTAHRLHHPLSTLRLALEDAGFSGTVIGDVPSLRALDERGAPTVAEEVREWLKVVRVGGLVVLDHRPVDGLANQLIQTDPSKGLTAHNAARAIELLLPPAKTVEWTPRR